MYRNTDDAPAGELLMASSSQMTGPDTEQVSVRTPTTALGNTRKLTGRDIIEITANIINLFPQVIVVTTYELEYS